MARTDLTVTPLTRAGLSLAAAGTAAIADGHMFTNNGRRMLRVRNTDSSSKTVTAQIPGTVDGQDIADRQYTIPATTGDVVIPPFPNAYNQADGKVYLDYSAITGLSVQVIELPAG